MIQAERIPASRRTRSINIVGLIGLLLAAAPAAAQDAAAVDFVRDIQPIFRTYCVGCHGPALHQNGFRLDRRSDAMRGGTIPVIGPGNANASRLYLRLIGSSMGPQMPPTGALKAEQIAAIKTWIDQGAVWPDSAAGETRSAPPDPLAVRMNDALRAGNRSAFTAAASEAKTIDGRRGADGVTPLMQAALYGSVDDVRLLLEHGADPNARNDNGATALLWAVHDADKVQLLLEWGAEVDAASDHGRTPLMAACSRTGAAPIVKLLLDYGADPSASINDFAPLVEASLVAEEAVFQQLLAAGVDVPGAGPIVPVFAAKAGCRQCAEWVADRLPKPLLDAALTLDGPPLGDFRDAERYLNRGADANARDRQGRTVLMLAAATDNISADVIKLLIQRGADVNARTPAGETARSFAAARRRPEILALLNDAEHAAPAATATNPATRRQPAPSPRAAVERSLPVLQETDATFLRKAGCVSCHHNTLTAMAVAAARTAGITVNETTARQQRTAIAAYVDSWRDRVLQGLSIPGENDTVSYILLGLAAEGHAADEATDAMAHFLLRQQQADGHYGIVAHRPPIESSDIEVTVATMRALQLYAPNAERAAVDRAVNAAAAWLRTARATTSEDRVFRLLGLRWSGAPNADVQAAARELAAAQRADGGWSQLPTLDSDAYATGQALFALTETGTLTAADRVIARGVKFLIDTQLADGSWFVRSRAIPLQPYFESGFPHGRDQWISAAATNWAVLALSKTIKKVS